MVSNTRPRFNFLPALPGDPSRVIRIEMALNPTQSILSI